MVYIYERESLCTLQCTIDFVMRIACKVFLHQSLQQLSPIIDCDFYKMLIVSVILKVSSVKKNILVF